MPAPAGWRRAAFEASLGYIVIPYLNYDKRKKIRAWLLSPRVVVLLVTNCMAGEVSSPVSSGPMSPENSGEY